MHACVYKFKKGKQEIIKWNMKQSLAACTENRSNSVYKKRVAHTHVAMGVCWKSKLIYGIF